MLELHVFGPYFGLPDASPFCLKALTMMKMSGLPFETRLMKFGEAPKGKAPYLKDGGDIIADSFFIQQHLVEKYQVDFTARYPAEKLATGVAVTRMLEEQFYFILAQIRWLRDGNFWKGPYQFFKVAPAPLRPLVARMVKRNLAKRHHGQGIGRHTDEERFTLALGNLEVVETFLSKNRFILGDKISGADATVFAFLWAAECPFFQSEVGDHIRSRPVLMHYLTHMAETYFPEYRVAV